MSEVKKKIEEAMKELLLKAYGETPEQNYNAKCDFENGAHFGIKLGREEMLQEVLEYVSGQCECSLDRKCIACALESKFKGKT